MPVILKVAVLSSKEIALHPRAGIERNRTLVGVGGYEGKGRE
jgi:hypothetical protein